MDYHGALCYFGDSTCCFLFFAMGEVMRLFRSYFFIISIAVSCVSIPTFAQTTGEKTAPNASDVYRKLYDKKAYLQHIEHGFDALDRDGDGKLERNEIGGLGNPDNKKNAKKIAQNSGKPIGGTSDKNDNTAADSTTGSVGGLVGIPAINADQVR